MRNAGTSTLCAHRSASKTHLSDGVAPSKYRPEGIDAYPGNAPPPRSFSFSDERLRLKRELGLGLGRNPPATSHAYRRTEGSTGRDPVASETRTRYALANGNGFLSRVSLLSTRSSDVPSENSAGVHLGRGYLSVCLVWMKSSTCQCSCTMPYAWRYELTGSSARRSFSGVSGPSARTSSAVTASR